MKCDLDCPSNREGIPPVCCMNCSVARRYYLADWNRHLWTEEHGFLTREGCSLPRDKMPPECVKYDCKLYDHIVISRFIDGKWKDVRVFSLPLGKTVCSDNKFCLTMIDKSQEPKT